jgi:type II secretory pathway pseudopilin PulG
MMTAMLTRAAVATSLASGRDRDGVFSTAELAAAGCSRSQIQARLDAGRWRRIGRAVVMHNGTLTSEQRWRAAVLNCGPRAVLASFSAAQHLGLLGWERTQSHVLAPAGVAHPRVPGLRIVLHLTGRWEPASILGTRRCQRIAPALILAASGFTSPRPACGILAAGVQQRLTTARDLRAVLSESPRVRHRRVLLAAVDDIAMGAQALSEIDFVNVCRRNGLPPPIQQAVRREPGGRRRYLDAEWRRGDGRRVVAEVDGAVHLVPRRWFDDQLRQNELMLAGSLVLRFPSVVIRTEEALVVSQLRRALFGGS